MKKILFQPWGGLGDNLQFSSLPRLFSERGYEVYISDKNTYRNREIHDLVWGINPYIKGFSKESPNCGAVFPYMLHKGQNIVQNWEVIHGFLPGEGFPEIYYTPKTLPEYENVIIVDLKSTSHFLNIPDSVYNSLRDKFRSFTLAEPVFGDEVNKNLRKREVFQLNESIRIRDIFHYCDVIHSCKHFVCVYSGQSVLAAALKKKNVTCILPEIFRSDTYKFSNIFYDYIEADVIVN